MIAAPRKVTRPLATIEPPPRPANLLALLVDVLLLVVDPLSGAAPPLGDPAPASTSAEQVEAPATFDCRLPGRGVAPHRRWADSQADLEVDRHNPEARQRFLDRERENLPQAV